jgi:hypothetical protein
MTVVFLKSRRGAVSRGAVHLQVVGVIPLLEATTIGTTWPAVSIVDLTVIVENSQKDWVALPRVR